MDGADSMELGELRPRTAQSLVIDEFTRSLIERQAKSLVSLLEIHQATDPRYVKIFSDFAAPPPIAVLASKTPKLRATKRDDHYFDSP